MLLRKFSKTLGIFWLILFAINANATNYYLSNSGNDANSGTDPSTPWQTLNKLNSFKNLKPGDSVLFRRGDSFYGSMTINNSGTASNPITFGAYGSGERPIITGFTNVTKWTNLGNNIWESTDAVSKLSTCNIVVINGIIKPMGRYPNIDSQNGGFLTYTSHTDNTSITDQKLTGSPNWTNAEVIIRKERWTFDRSIITNHSGNTISYSAQTDYQPKDGYGYFIQNDIRTLDENGEWYYNPTTKKLSIYSINYPDNVQLTTINNNLYGQYRDYVTVANIDFQGSNSNGFEINGMTGISVNNCSISYSGNNGVFGFSLTNLSVSNSVFKNINNNGILLWYNSPNAIINNNIFHGIGLNMGLATGEKYSSCSAIDLGTEGGGSPGASITGNTIDSVGYCGITGGNTNTIIKNNVISNFCMAKDDGGGIYPSSGTNDSTVQIIGNVVFKGGSARKGTPEVNKFYTWGIYADDNAHDILIKDNTVFGMPRSGIFLHNAYNVTVKSNTMYNNAEAQLSLQHDLYHPIYNILATNNVLASANNSQLATKLFSSASDLNSFGIIDSNFYSVISLNPFYTFSAIDNGSKRSFADWRATVGMDIHSLLNFNDSIRFECNPTSSSETKQLETTYTDLRGGIYKRFITLAPYTSAILVKKTDLTEAFAGEDQTINLPSNAVILSGAATIADGTKTSYAWLQVTGPSAATLTSPDSLTTSAIGLIDGIYEFQLIVEDNKGSVANDTVKVTVNRAANMSPTANAGTAQAITLPVNTIVLNGSGTDSDGIIASYQWTKIYGSGSGTINNANAASATVVNLSEGIYNFELKVTDNNGAVARDTVQVTVNRAPNIPPTSNAGTDKTIVLPISGITLSGSGNDVDGTIASYSWTKISGPSSYNMENPSSPITDVTGLTEGIYEFQLKVTDNEGAMAASTVQITVNPASKPPIVYADVNKTITLPVNSTTLTGSITETDEPISAILWTKISGPSAYNIANPSAANTAISGLIQGIYQFELLATDINGAQAKDTILITVNSAPNIPPTATAGANQTITLPTNTIILDGTATDSDGSISSYSWTKISGPSAFNIASLSSAATTVSGLVQGVYQFELKVTDDKGTVAKDTVLIIVNAAPNIAPIANAGVSQTITLPTNSVTLSGSGSDSDGSISSYSWTRISGPSSFNIANLSSAATTVSGLAQGVYQFELKVTDDKGSVGKDTVQITVNAAPNIAPTANAGLDKTITLPTNSVGLSGSGVDFDGTVLSYLWTKMSGPNTETISSLSSATTTVKGLIQGIYVFKLTVTDNNGAVGTDTVQVIVNPAPNIPPTATAGVNQTITLPTNTITISGSGADPDGMITSYVWTKMSGPNTETISSLSSTTTTVKGLIAGIYVFKLTVTDNNGAIGTDTVEITVNPAPNIPPTAKTEANQTITLPVSTVTLNGSGIDSDGVIESYQWTKISGPDNATINNPNAASTTVTNLSAATYQFELMVTDDRGAKGKDTVKVTVNPKPNIPPKANAGNAQTVTLPVNAVTLNGSGTDSDGVIASYQWTKISGPDNATINNPNVASATVINLSAGTYQFELTVSDDKGAKDRDTIMVTVGLQRQANDDSSGNFKIYPNPVLDIATIEMNGISNNSYLEIIISDVAGKIFCKYFFWQLSPTMKERVDISNAPKGTYLVTIFLNGIRKQSVKILKM